MSAAFDGWFGLLSTVTAALVPWLNPRRSWYKGVISAAGAPVEVKLIEAHAEATQSPRLKSTPPRVSPLKSPASGAASSEKTFPESASKQSRDRLGSRSPE
jgi:hypothetical protein